MSYIDTRDLAKELEELEDREGDEDDQLDEDEIEQLGELRSLEAEISEFHHGETLIPVDEFEDYARELAEDIGAIDADAAWPLSYIDWAAAAEALAQDYSEIEYQGTDYYYRSA